MIEFIFFAFGAVFGSFLNVCIHRFPREESIVHPASHCPQCSAPIAWHDNIPVLSYIALKGKCRKCKARISRRYVMVEILSGIIWMAAGSVYGITGLAFVSIFYFMILLGVSMTDVETGYIPDKFTLPSIAVGLIASAAVPQIHNQTEWLNGLFQGLLGVLVGGGILLGTGLLGNLIFKKESMGGGDIKLLAMMGAFLGASKIILVFLFAPVIAMPMALYVRYVRHQETIPYGPFLAITGAWMFLYGEELWKSLFVLS